MDEVRKQKTEREIMNEAQGIKVDVDFQVMVEQSMRNISPMQSVSHWALNFLAHPCGSAQDLCLRQEEASLLE